MPEVERLRDPSHTHALRLEEFRALIEVNLDKQVEALIRLSMQLEQLLASSFPVPGGPG